MAQSTQHAAASYAGSTAHDIKEKATDQFERMADKATDQFKQRRRPGRGRRHPRRRAGPRGRRAVQEVAGNFKGAVDKSVKDQPMATLAMVAVARLRARRAVEVVSPRSSPAA